MMPFLLAGDSYKILVLMNMAIVAGFSQLPSICIHTERLFCLISCHFDL